MVVSRVTLPSEFYDRTSELMLVQPEPQYVWARLLFMASGQAELRRAAALGISPDRAIAAIGAQVPDLAEMQLLLSDTVRGEAILVSDELGVAKHGHTVRINRPIFTNSTYTEASRTVAAGQTISTTPIDLTAEQVAITIHRQCGPYASSSVRPYAVDRMDAEHAVHSLASTVGLHMSRDRNRYVDTVIGGLFDTVASGNTLYPGDSANALSTDASAFVSNGDRPFDVETIFRAEENLNAANVPRFANGTYAVVLTPRQVRQLRSDPQFGRLSPFESEKNPLTTAFVGNIGKTVEVYVGTTQTIDTTTVSGVSIQHGVMFGPGKVGYANAGPCRVAASTDDNYGETAKVIWICYEGQADLDARFGCAIHSD